MFFILNFFVLLTWKDLDSLFSIANYQSIITYLELNVGTSVAAHKKHANLVDFGNKI